MDWYRLRHTIGMCLTMSATARAEYIKKHNIFYHMGDNCMTMFRKIPLYPKLISFGNNVWIASNVTFVTHDVIHNVINNMAENSNSKPIQENIGCIDINDNVFVGANTTILPNVTIGSNTVIAALSLVNKSLPGNGVYGGIPAKYICSFEEFTEKRKNSPQAEIQRGKCGLSEDTVNACWERMKHQQ